MWFRSSWARGVQTGKHGDPGSKLVCRGMTSKRQDGGGWIPKGGVGSGMYERGSGSRWTGKVQRGRQVPSRSYLEGCEQHKARTRATVRDGAGLSGL